MASDFTEYAFINAGGFARYEIVENARAASQVAAFKRMHGATAAFPADKAAPGWLFARKEAARDLGAQTVPASEAQRDVVLYRDASAREPVGRYPWHYKSKPDKRRTRIMHNCARYKLAWLSDLV